MNNSEPFWVADVRAVADRVRHRVLGLTLERNGGYLSVTGGLGSAVAEMMAENAVGKRLVRMGIDNTYSQGATFPFLLRKHGLDALSLVGQIEELIGQRLDITEDDLADTRTEDVAASSTEQLEAL